MLISIVPKSVSQLPNFFYSKINICNKVFFSGDEVL